MMISETVQAEIHRNQKVFHPGPHDCGPGFMLLCLITLLLTSCKQTSAFEYNRMILGVAPSNSINSSAREKAHLAAEANALWLLQLCHGVEFMIETRDNGHIVATLQNDVEMRGVTSTRIKGAESYAFVMYDMPKAERIPDNYINNRSKVFKVSGDADKVIRLILWRISEHGGKMLKKMGTSRGRVYVEVRNPLFRIKETPPTFYLDLLIWSGE